MNPPPPETGSLFIDRNSGGRTFRAILEQAGLRVALHDDHFPKDIDDPSLLHEVEKRGWVLLSGDKAMRKNVLFLDALRKCDNAKVFLLFGLNGKSPADKAAHIIAAHAKILSLLAESAGTRFWRFDSELNVKEIDFCQKLGVKKRR